jgi:hypothetical protein
VRCVNPGEHPVSYKLCRLAWVLVAAGAVQLVEIIPVLITGEYAEKEQRVMVVFSVSVAPLCSGIMVVMSMWPVCEEADFAARLVVHATAVMAAVIFMMTVVVVIRPVMGFASILLVMITPAMVIVTGVRSQW